MSAAPSVDIPANPTVRFGSRAVALVSLIALTLGAAACSPSPRQAKLNQPNSGLPSKDTRGLDRADRYLEHNAPESNPDIPPPQRPAAVIDGEPITWSALQPALAEAAGAAVLIDAALDARLARRFSLQGLTLVPAMIERERTIFAAAAAAAGLSGDDAAAALERLKAQRGLGPVRFAALLRRNAMLRALVQPEVLVNEASISQAYSLRHGDRFRARVISVSTANQASEALRRIRAGEDFSRVAAEVSTDASASRGGVIDPISPADPAYPQALRDTLAKMNPGEISSPIAMSQGFTIVVLDAKGPPPGQSVPPNPESVRADMEREARLRQERLLMEQLARELSVGPGVRPLDPSLRWSIDSRN